MILPKKKGVYERHPEEFLLVAYPKIGANQSQSHQQLFHCYEVDLVHMD